MDSSGVTARYRKDRWPDTANLPGATWEIAPFNLSGGFTATLVAAVDDPGARRMRFTCVEAIPTE